MEVINGNEKGSSIDNMSSIKKKCIEIRSNDCFLDNVSGYIYKYE